MADSRSVITEVLMEGFSNWHAMPTSQAGDQRALEVFGAPISDVITVPLTGWLVPPAKAAMLE